MRSIKVVKQTPAPGADNAEPVFQTPVGLPSLILRAPCPKKERKSKARILAARDWKANAETVYAWQAGVHTYT